MNIDYNRNNKNKNNNKKNKNKNNKNNNNDDENNNNNNTISERKCKESAYCEMPNVLCTRQTRPYLCMEDHYIALGRNRKNGR